MQEMLELVKFVVLDAKKDQFHQIRKKRVD